MPQDAVDIARMAMTEALVIALPILAAGLVVGLLVSLFQAVTQIQEQTLSFVPKIIVTALATMALLGWIALRLMDFATDMFTGY